MGQTYLLFSVKLGHRALAWMVLLLHRLDGTEDASMYKVGRWWGNNMIGELWVL